MTPAEVLSLLEANRDDAGVAKWNARTRGTDGLSTVGIGLTKLRKLAKEVGRDHALSQELWESDVYDAKIVALLIDDPNQMTPERAEAMVDDMRAGYLAHVFSTCGAPLAKTKFAVELASDWMASSDATRRGCGYALLYEISKSKKKSAPDDVFFLARIEEIESAYSDVDGMLLGAMGGALMGMGKRNKTLNAAALRVARKIGPIDLSTDGRKCEPFDVERHLTSDYLRKKLGL